MLTFTVQTKDFFEALKIVKKLSGVRNRKQMMSFLVEIMLFQKEISICGKGVMQKVPTLSKNMSGMIRLPIGLILGIVSDNKQKELCIVFSNGAILHSNVSTQHPLISVSKNKASAFEGSLINTGKKTPKKEFVEQKSLNKNQGQLFIQQDLFDHKGQDKQYIDTMLNKLFMDLVNDLCPMHIKSIEEVRKAIQVKSGDTIIRLHLKPHCKIEWIEKDKKETIYNQSLDYQALNKQGVAKVLQLMTKAKAHITVAKQLSENITID
jgi:hypothetical protein